jgi:hypothetical protein
MTRTSWHLCFLTLVGVLGLSGASFSATVPALDCSRAAVGNAVNTAANGDTVTVPAGTCSWTSNLTINKAITLQGSGVGNTMIQDSVPSGANPQPLIIWNLVANQTSRMTGIEFDPGTRTAITSGGVVVVSGLNTDSRRMRIDHCMFNKLNGSAIWSYTVLGVYDHNTILIQDGLTVGAAFVKDGDWNGNQNGDGAWAVANQFGTDQFLFFEDNTITYLGVNHVTLVDAQAGARYVFRHNTITRGDLDGHGTESGQRERSTRAVEVYNNTFQGSNTLATITYMRGGVGLIHDNTITGYTANAEFALLNNRDRDPYSPWDNADGADGTNRWDVNVAGGPFRSNANDGTVTAVGTDTMTVAGAPWTTNQWKGYAVIRTTNVGSKPGNKFSQIQSNTTNTITYESSLYTGSDLQFTVGDSWQFQKVNHALDQPGRCCGSLIAGDPPTLPSGWNNQTTSPWYQWNNKCTDCAGGFPLFGADELNIRANEHYFDNTPAPGYTPYTYPHPLVQGGSSIPSAPTNLRITP